MRCVAGERSGPPLVLLAAERELTLVDLPGFGNSAALPDDTDSTIDALTDAVERWLPELGLERPHVAGNSLGGAVGLELARRGAVASVAAISPAGSWSGAERRFAHRSLHRRPTQRPLGCGRSAAGRHAAAAAPAAVRADVHARRADDGGRGGRAHGHAAAGDGFHATLPHADGYEFAVGALPVPATIAWGTRDGLLPPTQARRARRRLPDADQVWLRGCGHVPMSDDPEQAAAVILRGSAGPIRTRSSARAGRPPARRGDAADRRASPASSR